MAKRRVQKKLDPDVADARMMAHMRYRGWDTRHIIVPKGFATWPYVEREMYLVRWLDECAR